MPTTVLFVCAMPSFRSRRVAGSALSSTIWRDICVSRIKQVPTRAGRQSVEPTLKSSSGQIRSASAFEPARLALTRASIVAIGIARVVFVSLRTVSLLRLVLSLSASLNVFSPRYWLKVVWIYARTISAQMVNGETIRDRTNQQDVDVPVRDHCVSVKVEMPITVSDYSTDPYPTLSGIVTDFRAQSFGQFKEFVHVSIVTGVGICPQL